MGFYIVGDDLKPVLIGRVWVSLRLLSLAINNGFIFYNIFDSSTEMLYFGNLIYDLDSETIKKDIENLVFDSINSNILYIDRIEILPEYRQYDWDKKVIKDILCRFSCCSVSVVLKAFPLQLKKVTSETAVCNNKMRYEKMEQNEYLANKKLFNFYKSLGFERLLNTDYFFYNSEKKTRS
jgi:hypothetical protein